MTQHHGMKSKHPKQQNITGMSRRDMRRETWNGRLTLLAVLLTAPVHGLQSPAARIQLSRESFLVGAAASVFGTAVLPALADEIGVEKDAPTLVTGETVEICTKRGPLGACLKTELRSDTNDNDVAKKYFKKTAPNPTEPAVMKMSDDDSNALIQKLRQQSIDNKEQNDLMVLRKTFENNQSATFGPFDRKVLILNTDGRTYTLLDNPVAMRLKQAGFIDGKRSFIQQPTAEDMDKAERDSAGGGLFQSLFGGASEES